MLFRNVVAAVVAVVMGAATLAAQENSLVLYAHGGAQSPWTDLNAGGSAFFEDGTNFGAGVGLQLHPNVTIRGDMTWARSKAVGPLFESPTFHRLFLGGDVRVGWPLERGIEPYAFGGVGAVRISESEGGAEPVTTPAGRLGAGLAYAVPGTRFSAFGQVSAWHYKFYGWPGLDRFQWDAAYSVGVSYRFDLPWA